MPTLARLTNALADRYAIHREIGAGGMAVVYLAEDLKHHREVAIKVLRPELAASLGMERFLREIEIAARLSHPHILPLHDSGAVEDILYYVMPYVAGESLRSRLMRQHQLPLEDALRLTREVASALGFAHSQGIVHRDIKPENILLADGIALVADFGIARAIRSSRGDGNAAPTALTAVGIALGTPAYMSPEQFTADEVDGRSDLYALGCVLFEMLAGQPPFTGPTLEALLRMHLTTEPRPLNELRPTAPMGVVRLVARALAKDPDARFLSAAAMAEAVAAAASGAMTPVLPQAKSNTPNNLPKPRTRFIGRDRELAECAQLLGETRLLTLTGIGGSGKTRLALRLGDVMLPTFPDGVWLADFAPLVDEGRVAVTAAAALGATESADKSIADVVRDQVAGKQVLLIFDNCEHVLIEVASLVETILAESDGVRFVATSREGLGLDEERLFAVRSMAVPLSANTDVHLVEASEAVRLFEDRAQAARRDFALTPGNAATVADICRRLDGIPLAIELAAARMKALSVEQIRSHLDDRFRLLTGGRSALPRQQTLLATLHWSYDLLAAEEQRLLRALSVFAGGWTLETATVVGGNGADAFTVLDVMTRLIDKSLVQVDAGGEHEARYSMLETVRQYGLERLVEAGEGEVVRDRHAGVFLALAERFSEEKFTREELWGKRLERELDNVRASLVYLRDRDAKRYLELAGALSYFWFGRSHMREGREHLDAALALTDPHPASGAYARAVRGYAMLVSYEGEHDRARELTEAALAMWRELGDAVEIAHSLETIGWAQFLASEDEASCATFEELLQIQHGRGDPVLVNRAKLGVAQTLVALSRVDEARPLAAEIVAFSQKAGDRRSEHTGFHFLADCALIEGNCAESLGLYRESLILAEAIGDRVETSAEIEGVAMSLAGLGQHAEAVRLVAATRAEWSRSGITLQIRFWDALIERYIGPARVSLGSTQVESVMQGGREMTFEAAVAEAKALATPR